MTSGPSVRNPGCGDAGGEQVVYGGVHRLAETRDGVRSTPLLGLAVVPGVVGLYDHRGHLRAPEHEQAATVGWPDQSQPSMVTCTGSSALSADPLGPMMYSMPGQPPKV